MQEEIWKQFSGRYWVSNTGKVKSDGYGELQKQTTKLGYESVSLWLNGKQTHQLVHRLVALLFIPNPFGYKEINHKDGNKHNNCVDNLEWCTRSQNVQHAFDNGLKRNKRGSDNPMSVSFYQFNTDGKLIRKWGSTTDCASYLEEIKGYPAEEMRKQISACLHGRFKTCCGFIFSFYPEIDLESHMAKSQSVPVISINERDGSAHYYPTIQHIKMDGAPATNIVKCCKGKRKHVAGLVWKYASDPELGGQVCGDVLKFRYSEREYACRIERDKPVFGRSY